MSLIVWPSILKPRGIQFTIDARSRSGGVSLTGVEQIAASSGGVWRARFSGIPVNTPARRKLWRALEAQIQGRVNDVLVPRFCADAPRVGGLSHVGDIPHSDGALFSDGSGYGQCIVGATFAADAALRATQITLNVLQGTIEPGQEFSAGRGTFYRIASLVESDGDDHTVTIWPPLRAAVTAGADADFANAACRMKLVSDDAMAAEFDLGRFASLSLDFIEAL